MAYSCKKKTQFPLNNIRLLIPFFQQRKICIKRHRNFPLYLFVLFSYLVCCFIAIFKWNILKHLPSDYLICFLQNILNVLNAPAVILKSIRKRLRMAVSREEKWYPTILRVIYLYYWLCAPTATSSFCVLCLSLLFTPIESCSI